MGSTRSGRWIYQRNIGNNIKLARFTASLFFKTNLKLTLGMTIQWTSVIIALIKEDDKMLDLSMNYGRMFHEKINEIAIKDYLINKLSKNNETDEWSKLISVIHWMQVAEKGLETFPDIYHKDPDILSYNFYLYVMSLDIIIKSLEVINHCFCKGKIPILEEKDAFTKVEELSDQSNKRYFNNIRAVYGAHSADIEFWENGGKKNKYSSSWAQHADFLNGLTGTKFDITLSVWPKRFELDESTQEKIHADIIRFSVSFKELNDFVQEAYNYSETMLECIDLQYEEFKKTLPIEITIHDDMNKTIEELSENSMLRNGFGRFYIKEVSEVFDLDTSSLNEKNLKLLNEYKSSIINNITFLRDYLLEFDYEKDVSEKFSLLFASDCKKKEVPEGYFYYVSKLVDWVSLDAGQISCIQTVHPNIDVKNAGIPSCLRILINADNYLSC